MPHAAVSHDRVPVWLAQDPATRVQGEAKRISADLYPVLILGWDAAGEWMGHQGEIVATDFEDRDYRVERAAELDRSVDPDYSV